MTLRVDFDDALQIEVVLRAGLVLKYQLPEDEDSRTLNGSTVFAAALNRLRDGMIAGAAPRTAAKLAQWYRLSGFPRWWPLVARRAAGHPSWADLSESERREWVETLASPLAVDEDALAAVTSRAGSEPHDSDDQC